MCSHASCGKDGPSWHRTFADATVTRKQSRPHQRRPTTNDEGSHTKFCLYHRERRGQPSKESGGLLLVLLNLSIIFYFFFFVPRRCGVFMSGLLPPARCPLFDGLSRPEQDSRRCPSTTCRPRGVLPLYAISKIMLTMGSLHVSQASGAKHIL
jgi:hypothetical protein